MALNLANETLEERLERIRIRNEELEKKHKEAEEDRLMALRDNAMVATKPNNSEWPKQHKYDNIVFDYEKETDEPDTQSAVIQTKVGQVKQKQSTAGLPPPDPTYNFLADEKRDGAKLNSTVNRSEPKLKKQLSGSGLNEKPDDNQMKIKPRQSNPNFGREKSEQNKDVKEREEIKSWRSSSNGNEEKISWRREKQDGEPNKLFKGMQSRKDDPFKKHFNKKEDLARTNQQRSKHNYKEQVESKDLVIENRGNITVSLTKDGEVKSVKLNSTPSIGTGRVRPRQFEIPYEVPPINDVVPNKPKSPNVTSYVETNRGLSSPILVDPFTKPSVQERLNRIRNVDINIACGNNVVVTVSNDANT